MPRNRTEFTKTAIATMRRMMKAGATAAQIAKTLGANGVKASAATVGRWMREQRGARRATTLRGRARRAPPSIAPPPSSSDEQPEEELTPKQRLDRLIARSERHLAIAETEENAAALASMMRVQVGFLKEIRMAARDAKPDPKDAPDFVSAAKRARDRLHSYVDRVGAKAAAGDG